MVMERALVRLLRSQALRATASSSALVQRGLAAPVREYVASPSPTLDGISRVEILDVNPEDETDEDGANVDLDSERNGKCVVLKTSTRQLYHIEEARRWSRSSCSYYEL